MFLGRLIKGVGGLYEVAAEGRVYECTAAGVFRNRKITPVIGDICEINVASEADGIAAITHITERKNEILRPRVSNIDQIIIVVAADNPPLDINLLDRYLAVLENKNFDIVICVNKSDLGGPNIDEILRLYADIGYKVIYMSAVTGEGAGTLFDTVSHKVSAFAGPSGVGKSSIINLLAEKTVMPTGDLSKKISKGKHTTRHVELLNINGDTFVMDTPGFTSLTLDGLALRDLEHLFVEFGQFLGKCAFRDCAHINEPDCAVKNEVGKSIHTNRYDNYKNFYRMLQQSAPLSTAAERRFL